MEYSHFWAIATVPLLLSGLAACSRTKRRSK